MGNLGASLSWGLAVGASLLAGAVVAALCRLPERTAATVTAFGGGLLLAAVALELVPEADREAGPWLTAAGLLGGTALYVLADAWLTRDQDMMRMRRSGHAAMAGRQIETQPAGSSPGGSGSVDRVGADAVRGQSIAVGLFVDGVPESLALGLMVADGEIGLALLAGILVGNVVEAYGAAQPIVAGGRSRGYAVGLLGAIGLALALATVAGGTILAGASPAFVGTAQAVAAGAVLAVISIAIIPHAFEEVSRRVASATVLGFLAGYLLS